MKIYIWKKSILITSDNVIFFDIPRKFDKS